ncbi:hypothetical protein Hanom_Chr07g00678581 [Helianthus anomalus]
MDRHDEHSGKLEEILSRLLSSYNNVGVFSGNHPTDLLSPEYEIHNDDPMVVTRRKEDETRFGFLVCHY